MEYYEQLSIDNSSASWEVASTPLVTHILARLGLSEVPALSGSSVKQLLEALQDHCWERRASAATALGNVGATVAIGPLVATLHDDHEEVRAATARSLGHLGSDVPADHLLIALKDELPLVREAAATALGNVGATVAIGPLVAALHDDHEEVRAAATQALGRLGGGVPVDHLVAALQDGHPLVREAAAIALGTLGNNDARLSLLAHIQDEEATVRDALAQALMALERGAWQKLIINLLREGEESVQQVARSAVNELVDLGLEIHETVAPIAPLVVALHSTQKSVQKMALCYLLGRAFDTMEGQIPLEPLITLLCEASLDTTAREGIWRTFRVLAQGMMKERRSLRLLAAAVNDPDPEVQDEIGQALRWLVELALTLQEEQAPIESLQDILHHPEHPAYEATVRSFIHRALEALDEPESIGPLFAELRSPQAQQRAEAGKKLSRRARKAIMARIPAGPLFLSLRRSTFTPFEFQFGIGGEVAEIKEERQVFPWRGPMPADAEVSLLPEEPRSGPLAIPVGNACYR